MSSSPQTRAHPETTALPINQDREILGRVPGASRTLDNRSMRASRTASTQDGLWVFRAPVRAGVIVGLPDDARSPVDLLGGDETLHFSPARLGAAIVPASVKWIVSAAWIDIHHVVAPPHQCVLSLLNVHHVCRSSIGTRGRLSLPVGLHRPWHIFHPNQRFARPRSHEHGRFAASPIPECVRRGPKVALL